MVVYLSSRVAVLVISVVCVQLLSFLWCFSTTAAAYHNLARHYGNDRNGKHFFFFWAVNKRDAADSFHQCGYRCLCDCRVQSEGCGVMWI